MVGAGLAGLMAARALRAAGHEVVLWDKGRSPGGRLATRRIGAATLDHGAQFFTVRSEQFAAHVALWQREGLVREWCRGFGDPPDGHPRFVVRGGMNALAKHLAAGLDVRCSSLVFSLHRSAAGWEVRLDDGSSTEVEALVVTCPLPQTSSLLFAADVALPEALGRTDYERTLCLLAVLDGPTGVPAPGGLQGLEHLTFVADNHAKGVSTVPALTVHADAAWSLAHWDDAPDDALAALTQLARPWTGTATVVASQLKRWRFATPVRTWPEPCWQPEDHPTVVVAGDAFAGPRVEGAARSGLAAAEALAEVLAT